MKATDTPDLRFVLRHFTDGAVVDPRRCPRGISARGHWHVVEGIFLTGEPNTACACTEDATSPAATGEAHDQAAGLLAASSAAD